MRQSINTLLHAANNITECREAIDGLTINFNNRYHYDNVIDALNHSELMIDHAINDLQRCQEEAEFWKQCYQNSLKETFFY